MAKQLTNKQIETLAKAIVRQVTKVASKKASKDPKANKLLKELEALDKKIAKIEKEKNAVAEKRGNLITEHNKSSKETRIEREYRYSHHDGSRQDTYMVLPQKEFADGVRGYRETPVRNVGGFLLSVIRLSPLHDKCPLPLHDSFWQHLLRSCTI